MQCTGNQLLPTGSDPRQATPAGFIGDETAEVHRVQTTGVGSWGVMAPDETAAKAAMDVLRQPATRACVERTMADLANTFVGQIVVTSTATVDLDVAGAGDEVLAFRTRLVERSVNFDVELTAIRRGRALAYLLTGRLGSVPFEPAERLRLTALIAARMG